MVWGNRTRREPQMMPAADLRRRVATEPRNLNLRLRLASACLREGLIGEAEEQLRICLALTPTASPDGRRDRLLVTVLACRLRFLKESAEYRGS